ncbi:MAG: ABC transporter permease [Candidatus Aminicenantes bacterium]|nr:ABC transporter permease [Candidatus Aminicenantes bacterium]
MIKNYIKIAWRHMNRQKIYTVITISGLVLGLAIFTMFALVTEFASSYDMFQKNADRIYAVVQVLPGAPGEEQHSAFTPGPLVSSLKNEFPEIEKTARFFLPGRMVLKHQEKVFYETGIRFVDPDFLTLFSFKMINGERATALSGVNSIVLTEDSALKYFGEINPIGKTMTLDKHTDLVVTGITENNPEDSSIRYEFLVSMETARSLPFWKNDWKTNNQTSFLLLSEETEAGSLEAKFPSFVEKYYADAKQAPRLLYLHPLPDFFLKSQGMDCPWPSGRVSYATIWFVAVLLLIIACINFMNLSTARYATRAYEVGMRKVVGASRGQLIKQFIGESTLLALLSLPGAILLYELISPLAAAQLGSIFSLPITSRPQVLILITGVTLLTGLLAGIYPAFYLSSFKPVSVFQKQALKGKKGSRMRKILVVVQFTFSIMLILMTFITIKQDRHNLRVDLGFDRNNILAVTINEEVRDKIEAFKKELIRNNHILAVSASASLPVEWEPEERVFPEGAAEEEALEMNVYRIDTGFTEILDIDMVQGRSLSPDTRDSDYFVINQTAARQLQWEDPVGKQMTIGERKGMVIGVAKDFHFSSLLLSGMPPAVLTLDPKNMNYLLIKYSSAENLSQVLEYTQKTWRIFAPDVPFEHVTLDTAFSDSFEGDKTSELTGALGVLAIFLSCLGLFGLSSYSVERRIKEIGIRKVLGASVSGIVGMLTKDFLKQVAIANVVAIPAAYFIMKSLINFLYVYPIKIGAGLFILTAFFSLLVAFLTVSSQTLKSASTNPAKSLRYE